MNTNELLNNYKNKKKYTQDKQIAMDLNISAPSLCRIRKGTMQLNDLQVIFLAEEANLNPKEALLGIHADRNENPKIKAIWEDMLAKMKSHGTAIIKPENLAISGLVLFAAPYAKCAQ